MSTGNTITGGSGAIPPQGSEFSKLDPQRLAARRRNWCDTPRAPRRRKGDGQLPWSLRVPLDDGMDCYGSANDYYPRDWGSGDYGRSPIPGAARMHRTKDGMYFNVVAKSVCPSRKVSPRIISMGACSHGGIERHAQGDCVSGVFVWRDGISGRYHRPNGAGPKCVTCGPASRLRPRCAMSTLPWGSQRKLVGLVRSVQRDYEHMFGPRSFRLEGGSGWVGFWAQPPTGKVHVMDDPREPWIMYFTVESGAHYGCRAGGEMHGPTRCVSGSYIWVDGKWGEYHLPVDRALNCTRCSRRPGRGEACAGNYSPNFATVNGALSAPRPPFYMAFLATGVAGQEAWSEPQRTRRLHLTPFGTYYLVTDATRATGRALTTLGHGFAFHGEEYLPFRCVHCGDGPAASGMYCKVVNSIPPSLLRKLGAS